MQPAHIDDFHYVTAEVFCKLYAAFPVRHLLLVEDLTGPIRWDMTGLPDRKSRASFETLIWLSEHGLLNYRTVEPRDIGVEGAVLSQHGFVLLSGRLTWHTGESSSRINALREARAGRAYGDLGTIVEDLLAANCHWSAPRQPAPLVKGAAMAVTELEADEDAL
ncbi:hypothetical protein [Pseudohaliea rubra]|uniref:Uncharacterized protein n=1 Tax=Pseudohaliea rubra DSM 19751 TaxID=1265313 RepID=A0A095VT71_9GAMM|nr:hypothetical protein [Pseudohaliea rubra]KGE04632.1 hypothetical protein HRUBRA_00791 [Pseudohaliea rubra DSM 19751]